MSFSIWSMPRVVLLGTMVLFLASKQHVEAAFSVSLDVTYSGTGPANAAPIRATFTDVVGGVQLKLEDIGLTSTEFVSQWYLNLNPTLNVSQLTIAYQSGVTTNGAPLKDTNNLKADGDGYYDIRIDFETSTSSANRFDSGSTSIFLLTYTGTGTFNADSFAHKSVNQQGQFYSGSFYSAAHVQGITGGLSGWQVANKTNVVAGTNAVPAPPSAIATISGLAIFGLVGFARLRRRPQPVLAA